MVRMGMLGQLDLGHVLQRAEAYAKTGLLLVRQGERWVELYFQQGRLLCVGPVKAGITLWEQLLQADIISLQAQQEVMLTLGPAPPSEARMAHTLISLGYVSHERLCAWVAAEATRTIQLPFTWTTGEICFEEERQPPTDRYLVDLSIVSLLTSIGIAVPQSMPIRATAVALPPTSVTGPTRMRASELLSDVSSIAGLALPPQEVETPSGRPQGYALGRRLGGGKLTPLRAPTRMALPPANADGPTLMSASELLSDISSIARIVPGAQTPPVSGPLASGAVPPSEPRRVSMPLTPLPIDTSFMRPEMVLVPRDLSSLRTQNPQIQLTPEQWYLFARADGHTSLQNICQTLGVPPGQVCQVVGELIALGLVHVIMPTPVAEKKVLQSSKRAVSGGLSTGPLAFGATAAPVKPQAQARNSNKNMSFVPGYGWVDKSQRLQALEPSGALDAVTDGFGQTENARYRL